jgi:hypothetical protein
MEISNYLTYDLPIPYKNIKIYPVKVKDYVLFGAYSQCLTIDKNSIPDPKIISMTYLEYIYDTAKNEDEKPYLIFFDRLLGLSLPEDESFKDPTVSLKRYGWSKEEPSRPIFVINDEPYNSDDFEIIREIIAQQNMVELIDENISKEVRDSLEEAREFKRKLSGNKSASTEDYIISLASATGWTFEYIYSMSIRKFVKSIRRLDNLIHYKIYLAASMSGMVKFEDTSFIKHWLTSLDDGEEKYSDVSVDLQEMQDKVSLESAKK